MLCSYHWHSIVINFVITFHTTDIVLANVKLPWKSDWVILNGNRDKYSLMFMTVLWIQLQITYLVFFVIHEPICSKKLSNLAIKSCSGGLIFYSWAINFLTQSTAPSAQLWLAAVQTRQTNDTVFKWSSVLFFFFTAGRVAFLHAGQHIHWFQYICSKLISADNIGQPIYQ